MSFLTDSMKPQVDVIKPNWSHLVPKNIDAFFSCRTGGVSSGPWGGVEGFQGLNLSKKTGDYARSVEMNRSILTSMCASAPRWITQVHGTTIVKADSVTSEDCQADATYSETPNVVCAVMTADCLPVLVTEKKGRIVAAIHAGWKGLAAGIISKTIRELNAKFPEESPEWVCWLGPRIGKDDFEVGLDVVDAFKANFAEVCAFKQKENGKFLCDLALLAKYDLVRVGVKEENICDSELSTYSDPEKFYSYRRDGEKSGRHVACIWISK